MIPATHRFEIRQGATTELVMRIKEDGSVMDLSDAIVRFRCGPTLGNDAILQYSTADSPVSDAIEIDDEGWIRVTITPEDAELLTVAKMQYQFDVIWPGGADDQVDRYLAGSITVIKQVENV